MTIDFCPGYRVYFRQEKGQQKAIDGAKLAWKVYEWDRKQSARKEKRK